MHIYHRSLCYFDHPIQPSSPILRSSNLEQNALYIFFTLPSKLVRQLIDYLIRSYIIKSLDIESNIYIYIVPLCTMRSMPHSYLI